MQEYSITFRCQCAEEEPFLATKNFRGSSLVDACEVALRDMSSAHDELEQFSSEIVGAKVV